MTMLRYFTTTGLILLLMGLLTAPQPLVNTSQEDGLLLSKAQPFFMSHQEEDPEGGESTESEDGEVIIWEEETDLNPDEAEEYHTLFL